MAVLWAVKTSHGHGQAQNDTSCLWAVWEAHPWLSWAPKPL